MRVRQHLSGIVGVVRNAMSVKVWAAVCCLALAMLVVNPASAVAEPDAPEPPPTTVIEVPVQEAPPQVVLPEQQAPQTAPVPEVAPPAPPVVEVPPPPAPAPSAPEVVPPFTPAPVPPVTVAPPVEPAPQTVAPPAETRAPVSTPVVTATPEPAETTTVTQKPEVTATTEAPRETEVAETTQAPAVTSQAPASADETTETATESTESDATEEVTKPEGAETSEAATSESSSKGEAGVDTTITTETPAPVKETEAEVVAETVAAPSVFEPQDGAEIKNVALVTEDPVSAKEVTTALPEDVAEALQSLVSTRDRDSDDNRDDNRGNGRDHDRDKPRDPKGWDCKDNRGPSWCQWKDWDYDDYGRPQFHNRFSFNLTVVVFDHFTGQRYEVIVRSGSTQPINAPHTGNFGFLVVGVSAPGFALNVGMGMFSSGDQCSKRCPGHQRPDVNFELRINLWIGNTFSPRYVPVYDCGCGPYQVVDGREYYQYYFGGTRDVIGYWEGAPYQSGSNFVPVQYRPTPAAPEYAPVTPGNVGQLTGVEKPGGDPSQNPAISLVPTSVVDDDSKIAQIVGVSLVAAIAIIVVGGLGYRAWQRRRISS